MLYYSTFNLRSQSMPKCIHIFMELLRPTHRIKDPEIRHTLQRDTNILEHEVLPDSIPGTSKTLESRVRDLWLIFRFTLYHAHVLSQMLNMSIHVQHNLITSLSWCCHGLGPWIWVFSPSLTQVNGSWKSMVGRSPDRCPVPHRVGWAFTLVSLA